MRYFSLRANFANKICLNKKKKQTNKLSREECDTLQQAYLFKLSCFKEGSSLKVDKLALALWVVVP